MVFLLLVCLSAFIVICVGSTIVVWDAYSDANPVFRALMTTLTFGLSGLCVVLIAALLLLYR